MVADNGNGNGSAKKLGGCTGKGFMPGKSGNPTGKPRGVEGLAAYIRRVTSEGRELVDIMVAIARAAPQDVDRRGAVEWLSQRAFGKVPEQIVLGGEVQVEQSVIIRILADAESRDAASRLAERLASCDAGASN